MSFPTGINNIILDYCTYKPIYFRELISTTYRIRRLLDWEWDKKTPNIFDIHRGIEMYKPTIYKWKYYNIWDLASYDDVLFDKGNKLF